MNIGIFEVELEKGITHLNNAKNLEKSMQFFKAKDEYFYACQHFLLASKIADGSCDNENRILAEKFARECETKYSEMIYKQWEKNNFRTDWCK